MGKALRVLALLLLLGGGLWLLLRVYQAERAGVTFALHLPGWARPSTDPLPLPWQGQTPLVVHPPGLAPTPAPAVCGTSTTVQPGETLGAVAQRCGVTAAAIISANPTILDPNTVPAGLVVAVPPVPARGGGDSLAVEMTGAQTRPGATLVLRAGGFPPNMPVRAGLGLSDAGFQVLAHGSSDSAGSVALEVTIPAATAPGQEAFFLLTTTGVPNRTAISEKFVIE